MRRPRYFAAGVIVVDPVEVLAWNDPHSSKAFTIKRREARLRAANVGLTERYRLRTIAERDGFTCHLCSALVDMTLSGKDSMGPTADHVLPVAKGGSDHPDNVRLAHRRCNVRRGVAAVA